MIRKLVTLRMIKHSFLLNKENYENFINEVLLIFEKKGYVIVALIGAPGSGKSLLCKSLINNEFLARKDILIIDDLLGSNGIKYSKKELRSIEVNNKKIIIVSDFRAAIYLNNIDFIIMLKIPEHSRLENLIRRNTKKYNLYKRKYYKIPPIPLKFINKTLYIVDMNNNSYLFGRS